MGGYPDVESAIIIIPLTSASTRRKKARPGRKTRLPFGSVPGIPLRVMTINLMIILCLIFYFQQSRTLTYFAIDKLPIDADTDWNDREKAKIG